MKKHILFSAILLITSNLLFSQFKLKEGPEYDTPKGYTFIDIHGYDETRFYGHHLLIHKINPKVFIECYDSKNLNRLFAKEVSLPQDKGEVYSDETKDNRIEVRYLNKKTFIFYSFFNEDLGISNVYYITVDQDGNISPPNKLVSNCIRYRLLTSADKAHFGLIVYMRNGKPKATAPNYHTFSDNGSFDFYDANTIEKKFSTKLVDFTGDIKISISDFQMSNSGTLSYLKREFDDSYIPRLKKSDLVVINPNSESPFYHNLEFPAAPNYINSTISSDLSISKKGSIYASFVVYTKDFNFLSLNSNINTTDKVNIEFNYVSQFTQSTLDLKCKFIPSRTLELGDNLYTFFYSDSKFGMLSKIKKDGSIEWSVPFPFSNQISELGLRSPYKILFINNKINIYYIDHSENNSIKKLNASNFKDVKTVAKLKGSNLVCLSIEENGIAKREIVYSNDLYSAIPTHYADFDHYFNSYFDPLLEDIPIIRLSSKDKEKFARIE